MWDLGRKCILGTRSRMFTFSVVTPGVDILNDYYKRYIPLFVDKVSVDNCLWSWDVNIYINA